MVAAPHDTLPAASLAAATRIGAVALTVPDLERSRDFYERVLGLQASDTVAGELALRAGSGPPLIELFGDSSTLPSIRPTTGLYHLAVLLPTRSDLARALLRLAHARWPLDGASDHLVSEALYLSDPDGNGIEIYRDRPREQWRWSNNQLEMATLPLDLEDILGELSEGDRIPQSAPPGTRIGHVHLQVSELDQVEKFYSGVLGFDVMVRLYPGALFVSAGGYHHHIGMNTWHSAGAPPPATGALGLRFYEILLAGEDEHERVLERVRAAGLPTEPRPTGELVLDPSGNALLLRAG